MEGLKRYQWFGYTEYYPSGGSGDIQGQGETIDELREAVRQYRIKWPASNLPDENEVIDLAERRWLSAVEVSALGLIPSQYVSA